MLRRTIRAHRRKAKELGYLVESNDDTYRDEEEFVDEDDDKTNSGCIIHVDTCD